MLISNESVSYNKIWFVPDMRMFCCKGFCMDLLRELAKTINFTYNLTLSPDGQFGSYINKNNSGIKCRNVTVS